MFEEMIASIQEETVKFCYNVTVETQTERRRNLLQITVYRGFGYPENRDDMIEELVRNYLNKY